MQVELCVMAIYRAQKNKPQKHRSPVLILTASILVISILYLLSSFNSTNGSSSSSSPYTPKRLKEFVAINTKDTTVYDKYLYWGSRIDCPGKHCGSCEGLGHQESSLRCALEEALFLNRYYTYFYIITSLSTYYLC